MAEYISRDDALLHSEIIRVYSKDYGNIDVVPVEYLADIPSADVQPVKRGWWMTSHPVDIAKEFKCTACGGLVELPVFVKKCYYDFCPNCGARMDGDTECHDTK